jgi:hypothetical protein
VCIFSFGIDGKRKRKMKMSQLGCCRPLSYRPAREKVSRLAAADTQEKSTAVGGPAHSVCIYIPFAAAVCYSTTGYKYSVYISSFLFLREKEVYNIIIISHSVRFLFHIISRRPFYAIKSFFFIFFPAGCAAAAAAMPSVFPLPPRYRH